MIQALRQAARSLALRPGFSLLVILIIALCVGGNASVFSLAKDVLFEKLPYNEADRLVVLTLVSLANGSDYDMSYVESVDWRKRVTLLEEMSPFVFWQDRLIQDRDSVERVAVNFVAPSYLTLLGIKPQLGRLFTPEETVPGNAPVVIISDELWQRRYARDPQVLGRTIQLNDRPYTVVGVMPPRFFDFAEYWHDIDLWLPAAMAGDAFSSGLATFESRGDRNWVVLARLKPGVSLEKAQGEIGTIAAQMQKEFPDYQEFGARIIPVREFTFRRLHSQMKALFAGAIFVLLIGCANIANLLLARQAERQRELSLRLALGASRLSLVREVLAQSAILAVLGGALGVLFAIWGTKLLARIVELPTFANVDLDGTVLALTAVATLVTGLLFGLPPAISVARMDSKGTLQQIKATAGGRAHSSRSRNGLLVFQVAVLVVLLVVAGLLLRSFLALRTTGVDFPTDRLLALRMTFEMSNYDERPNIARAERELLRELANVPGIEGAATWGAGIPGISAQYMNLKPAGASEADPSTRADAHFISPGALRVLELPVQRGREFSPQDILESPRVVVVTQALAEALWPGRDPLGQRLVRAGRETEDPWTVVGVIGNTRLQGRLTETDNHILFTHEQLVSRDASLLVRTSIDAQGMTATLRDVIRKIDPQIPVYDIATLEERLRKEEAGHRLNAVIVSGFSIIALILAVAGLYGMLAYSVVQKTKEIGIRMALGAKRQEVVGMVMGKGLLLVGAGLILGLAGALALARLLSAALFGVTARDPLTYAGVTAVFVAVALLATYLPARRASKVEPTIALRYE